MTVLAEACTGLAEVLVGRDRAPEWSGPAARRAAVAAGWLGWVVLACSGIVAVTLARHGNQAGQSGPEQGPAAVGWLAVGLVVAAALPLAPRFALLAWRLAFLGVLVTPLIPGQSRADGGFYAVLAVALAVAGLRYGPRLLWWMTALTLLPVWLWTGPDWVYPAVNTGWICGLAVVLHAVAYWRRDRRALAAQTQRAREQAERAREQAEQAREHAERARQQRERNAVLEERARIAREMHDVVAHHMSMIAVQAETAPYRVPDLPEPAQREFAALSEAAREALTDMRRLLGVLRSDAVSTDNSKKRAEPAGETGSFAGDSRPADDMGSAPAEEARRPAELAPQPCLDDIPALVEAASRAGARVTLSMAGPASRSLPAPVGLAAYRIVQESLSNAARHAPGASITVTVEAPPGRVQASVVNGPPARPGLSARPALAGIPGDAASPGNARRADAPDRTGHGLVGMRERAELLGGSLDAGPLPGGGFAVRAVLPASAPLAAPAREPAEGHEHAGHTA